jgi:hypothetical protein
LKIFVKIYLLIPTVLFSVLTRAQAVDSTFKTPKFFSYDSLHQTDIADVGHSIFRKKKSPGTNTRNESQAHVSILPAVGYSLQTGFAAILSANIAFHNGANEGQKFQQSLPVLLTLNTNNISFHY